MVKFETSVYHKGQDIAGCTVICYDEKEKEIGRISVVNTDDLEKIKSEITGLATELHKEYSTTVEVKQIIDESIKAALGTGYVTRKEYDQYRELVDNTYAKIDTVKKVDEHIKRVEEKPQVSKRLFIGRMEQDKPETFEYSKGSRISIRNNVHAIACKFEGYNSETDNDKVIILVTKTRG